MTILVVNCFHWLGFHIVNQLLEDGRKVAGIHIDSPESREHLADFVGRNSQFQLVDVSLKKEYDIVITIGDDYINRVKAKRYLIVNGKKKAQFNNPSITNIKVNMIFGEWMPMDFQGIFYETKHILFDSQQFLTNAIYVDDFVKMIKQMINTSKLPSEIYLRSRHTRSTKNESQAIFSYNQTPIEEQIKQVRTHYNTFKHWYLCDK